MMAPSNFYFDTFMVVLSLKDKKGKPSRKILIVKKKQSGGAVTNFTFFVTDTRTSMLNARHQEGLLMNVTRNVINTQDAYSSHEYWVQKSLVY